ncbi:MarR family transcriptional regulator [Leuconostoc pseudomesenteroides]|uniref:MarR family winged helix-turn-helix transcriptional regulator n=1 Tax=Leuconostoc pseudomesenteroides TaxID=33968 RepID=UPI0021A987C3|nr:MarR family winged helix-turn-helix transcriptional regulator [Leuconostoc pseudomesenteroides]MCT4388727.1 MarR family transcriptional regulator [Leuconostoc pseudomesenteroides]
MQKNNSSNIAMLYFAYQEFSQNIDLERFDINKTQHRILFLSSYLKNPTIKKLLKIMSITKQGFNKAYRDLESRHIITSLPSAKDSRIKVLYLTNTGSNIINQLNANQNEKLNHLLAKYDGDWEQVLQDMVDNYLKNF